MSGVGCNDGGRFYIGGKCYDMLYLFCQLPLLNFYFFRSSSFSRTLTSILKMGKFSFMVIVQIDFICCRL